MNYIINLPPSSSLPSEETTTSVLVDKLNNDMVKIEPDYSNINYINVPGVQPPLIGHNQANEMPKNISRKSSRKCDNISRCFANIKTICCMQHCGKYEISKENTMPIQENVINDVEKNGPCEKDNECKTAKVICCMVLALVLLFVAAGAILLYQSCK